MHLEEQLTQRLSLRKNITALAVCNALGRAIDPLIVFKGNNYESSWASN